MQDNIIDNFFEDVMVGLTLNLHNIYPTNIDLYIDLFTNKINLTNHTSYHNQNHENISINVCNNK